MCVRRALPGGDDTAAAPLVGAHGPRDRGHGRSLEALKQLPRSADAHLCGEPHARTPRARWPRWPAAPRWRGSGSTALPGTTTRTRLARPSTRSSAGTSSSSCASPPPTEARSSSAPLSRCSRTGWDALPCLLASAAIGVWLVSRMRSERRPLLHRGIALAVCVANPITLRALEVGHPEELLGACLCVAAVLLAAGDRGVWAGVLLGLAIANKQWALLAVGPVLIALPGRRRAACLASAALVAGIVLAPLTLVGSGGFVSAAKASATAPSAIFQPWQVWWFFGHHGGLVHGAFGVAKPDYRIGPGWAAAISHPLVVVV